MCSERTKGVDRDLQNSVPAAALLLSKRWADRHPDHLSAGHVLSHAAFAADRRRSDGPVEAWKPRWLCSDFINGSAGPSLAFDVLAAHDRERRALACGASQFWPPDADVVATRLRSPAFQLVESRDAHLGAPAGVRFAEGIVIRESILRSDLFRENQS